MKQKWVDAFMDTAERFAQLSSAVRLKVGAVIVKIIVSSQLAIMVCHLDGQTNAKTRFMLIHH